MRFRLGHHLSVTLLYLFVHLGLSACSGSDQQEDADLSEENEEVEQGEENMENEEMEEGNEEFNNEDELANQEGDENLEGDGNQTENDLQEIISEINQNNAGAGEELAQEEAPLEEQMPQEAEVPVEEGNAVLTEVPPEQAGDPGLGGDVGAADAGVADAGGSVGSGTAGQGIPEFGSKMPYEVQKGETLAKIASKIGTSWREIAELSSLSNPNYIYPGQIIYYQLSQNTQAFAQQYEGIQRNEVTVSPGDTLASLAARIFGKESSWRTLWRFNDNIPNPDKITPGMTLVYPNPAAFAALNLTSTFSIASMDLDDEEDVAFNNNLDNQEDDISTFVLDTTESNLDYELDTIELPVLVSFGTVG